VTTTETTAGLRKLGEGREAEVFAWGDGQVLKLFRDDGWAAGIEREAAAMNAVRDAGGPAPRAGETVRVDARPGLVMERVDGPALMDAIARRPWQVMRIGQMLGTTHATMHAATSPPALPPLRERLRGRIEREAPRAPELAHLAAFAIRRLDELPDGDRVCHGDFHPGNVLLSPSGPVVIDWPNATRGEPAADVARTLLMMRMGSLPPGTPWVIRTGALVARGVLRRAYVNAYCRTAFIDDGEVERWLPPVIANRLCDGIAEEREALVALLERERGRRQGYGA
jgi:Ser/Thr protein kinase RdoA (MazF antagonist)